jgi:hypothetical protein
VLLVVVQRRFFPESSKSEVGIGIDLNVIRVVIDAVGSCDCHRAWPLAGTA